MINVSGMPTIKHLNMRAIGGGEDEAARPAIDIKVSYEGVPFEVVATVMGNDDPADIERLKFALYEMVGKGDPRFLDFGTVRMGKALDGYLARIGRHEIKVETLKVIEYSFRPQHTVDMVCQIAVTEPPEDMVTTLHEHLGLAFPVAIGPDPEYKPPEISPMTGRDRRTPDMFSEGAEPGKPTEAERGVFAQKLAEAQAAKDGEVEKGDRDPLFAQACELVTSGQVECETKAITARFQVGAERGAALVRALVKAGVDKAVGATPISAGKKKAAAKKKAADGDGDLSPNLH